MVSPFPPSSSSPGEGQLVVGVLPQKVSALSTISFQYPLKLISPSPAANQKSVLVFLLTYGGGLVGGDQVHLTINIKTNSRLSIVTQGHTKIFKSPSPEVITRQKLHVTIEPGAALCLLPDPVQPFGESVYKQSQSFFVAETGSLCLLDWVSAGRTARGEDWDLWRWSGRNEVWSIAQIEKKPRLLLRDNVLLDGVTMGSSEKVLKKKMQGLGIFGTLVLKGPLMESLAAFFLSEFSALPRIGGRDFRSQEMKDHDSTLVLSPQDSWRSSRLMQEMEDKVLWSAAKVRGCTVVKVGARTVEGGRLWIGSMIKEEGSVSHHFGEDATMFKGRRTARSPEQGRAIHDCLKAFETFFLLANDHFDRRLQNIHPPEANGAPQTIQTMESSGDPLTEPDVTCSVCTEPYHTEFEPGITEYPFLTACGHVLGAACLKRWLENQSTCPICRFNLEFRCGHPIPPRKAFPSGGATPPTLAFGTGVPRSCLNCRLTRLHEYWSAKIDEYEGGFAYMQKRLDSLNAWFRLFVDSVGDADVETQIGLLNEFEFDKEQITDQLVRAEADWQTDIAELWEGIKVFDNPQCPFEEPNQAPVIHIRMTVYILSLPPNGAPCPMGVVAQVPHPPSTPDILSQQSCFADTPGESRGEQGEYSGPPLFTGKRGHD
ncbi:putative urease accessory protein ureD-like [Lachnellula hyalina]|uniref:Putative urease accessory protein ureD-like n=1 Tax=Lachnellula hyalina TaxID=1316788 RepID=A0A8H8U3R6_9HELO|nr:putative urease accessory protein ureD-like [Lachnellula hyalina]TVY29442.1 putative urease accessory protein ureD-like [Lachnellula hyalina]